MKNILLPLAVFLLLFSLTGCTKEEWDCIQEQTKISNYYNDLIEDAIGDIEEQERLMLLKEKELEDYDCLSRWNVK